MMSELVAGDSLPPEISTTSNTDFLDPHVLPDNFYTRSGGLACEIDLDIDLDGIDWDLSVDDLLLHEVPDPLSHPLHQSSDGSPQESGVSMTSCSAATSGDINACSLESGHSANCSDSGGELKRDDERSGWGTKRKKELEEVSGNSNPSPRSRKFRRSEDVNSCVFTAACEEEEKRKARLIRNRESAQLSRQRKKNYVEELEEKVRSMQSTITELNSKISVIMAENSSLKQQLGGVPSPSVAPMHFPWVPYPGLAFRPQGSLVPLIPIPKLRSQQAAAAQKTKRNERKKGDVKNRKLPSITLLGLLFFVMIFGYISREVDHRYNGSRDFGAGTVKDGLLDNPNGMVLGVTGRRRSLNSVEEAEYRFGNKSKGVSGMSSQNGKLGSKEESWSSDRHMITQNSSESLPALLYVPRNGKHVKINGNLIINSVLASEKAAAEVKSRNQPKQIFGTEVLETSLAIARNLPSGLPLSARDINKHTKSYGSSIEHQRALAADSEDKYMGTSHDGTLQQWFREGLAGPIFSSGTCTEVFQFEISDSSSSTAASAVVTAPPTVNPAKSARANSSSPRRTELRNRRFLYPHAIPLPGSTFNSTEGIPKAPESNNNASAPPMIVSILADPREVGDRDADGRISSPNKSLPRIFVVVLLDSIKYATYSCVLPFKIPTHLVN